MEALLASLRTLGARFGALPVAARTAIIAVVLLVAGGLGAVALVQSNATYEYAFTNLTPEDSGEAAQALKAAGIPFRLEAGGAAVAVPASKVYDARLLLASAGLPRGGGVGFEVFDRGDLGVSEFTQKVNLRRATEGELARTISKLSEVRSARVHLTFAEKGLFRGEDRNASAAVVLTLQPGRMIGEKGVAGIRHLVASAVPGLAAESVTVVDSKGGVLGSESIEDPAGGYQRKLERELEQRVVEILEPFLGAGAVVARANAEVDSAHVTSNAEIFDPDATAVRSERNLSQNSSQDSNSPAQVAGAAANQPLQPVGAATASGSRATAGTQDEVKNYEISRTTTTTVSKNPRLKRLSMAVVVDGVDGKPRTDAELARMRELAKRAIGFDETRGDAVEITSAVFAHAADRAGAEAAAEAGALPFWKQIPLWAYGAGGLLLLLLIAGVLAMVLRGRAAEPESTFKLEPGMRVAELEERAAAGALAAATANAPPAELPAPAKPVAQLPDPALAVREKARALAAEDPQKAAHLIRAWIAADYEKQQGNSNAS